MAMEDGVAPQVINAFIILCVVLLVVFAGIEAIVLLYSYLNADTVKCTFLWCEFTDVRGTANITISQECSVNGVPTDCAETANMTRLLDNFGYDKNVVGNYP